MFHDTTPAQLDATGAIDRWAPFRIQHRGELHALLRQVRDAGAPVVLAAPGGVSSTCTLWTLDPSTERLSFSADDSQPQLQTLVDADEAMAVTYLDSVKLQFDLDHLMLVRGKNGVVLQAAMPESVYRFQRRDSFRVRPTARMAPQLTLRHPALPDMLVQLRILDISVGGCALLVPHDVPELRPGLLINGAQVELDAETVFVAGLQLHHASSFEGSEAGRGNGCRIGCEWRLLDPMAERSLQRFVNQTQKRHRLLSAS